MEYKYHKRNNNEATLVLVHGFGEDYTIWNNIVLELADLNIIMPALPGWANTPAPADVTMESCAAMINDILEKENINQCILIGHSMGGYISMAFAEQYPDKLKGLGLIHSTTYADDEAKIAGRMKSVAFIEQHGIDKFAGEFVPNMFADEFIKANPALIEERIKAAKLFVPLTWISYLKAMTKRKDLSALLYIRKIPFLFIIGKKDKIIPAEVMLKQAHIPDISSVHVLENTGHMGMLEAPEEVVKGVKKFVEVCIIN